MEKRKRKKRIISKFPEPDFLPEINKKERKWDDKFIREVYYYTLLGATDIQIAQAFGISTATLEKWKRGKAKFKKALDMGKLEADAKVAHSLFLSAVGYSHPDQVVLSNRIREYDPDTGKLVSERTEPLVVDTVKSYPPNVTAIGKWLQSRQPDKWGNKLKIEAEFNHKHELDLTDYSEEELKVLRKLSKSKGLADGNIEDIEFNEVD